MFFDVKENQKLETYTSISKKENCTCSAIRNSVNRIRSLLVWVKDEERNNLIKIIRESICSPIFVSFCKRVKYATAVAGVTLFRVAKESY